MYKNRSDHHHWIKKHKKQEERDHKRDLVRPTAGTYNPLYQSFNTFEKINISPRKSFEKKNGFGNDARFPYVRPDKKKIKEVRPSPNSYNTHMNWRGKSDSSKGKEWYQSIWKGSMTESVYKNSN